MLRILLSFTQPLKHCYGKHLGNCIPYIYIYKNVFPSNLYKFAIINRFIINEMAPNPLRCTYLFDMEIYYSEIDLWIVTKQKKIGLFSINLNV